MDSLYAVTNCRHFFLEINIPNTDQIHGPII